MGPFTDEDNGRLPPAVLILVLQDGSLALLVRPETYKVGYAQCVGGTVFWVTDTTTGAVSE